MVFVTDHALKVRAFDVFPVHQGHYTFQQPCQKEMTYHLVAFSVARPEMSRWELG
jgi:hypothetical protein